ncbi:MAG: M16 family metallopeptidase [Rectinemataceae bacterium]
MQRSKSPLWAAALITALFLSGSLMACAGAPAPAPEPGSAAATEAAAPAPAPEAALPAAGAAKAPAPLPPLPPVPPMESSTRQVRLDALESRFAQGDVGAFARDNSASFTSFSLSNGIPVVVRKNDANRVRSLSIVLRGGSLIVEPSRAGMEGVMLRTMARGSAAWPYGKLAAKLDETSSSISAESAFEHSTYTLTTIDRYFDEMLPIWAGTLTNPSWGSTDFDRVLSDSRLALKKKTQDPWQTTALAMNKVFFEGHPYASTTDGTTESLASLDLATVKTHYERTWSANRLFVVAVGNYDVPGLKAALEAVFGAIKDRDFPVPVGAATFEGRVRPGLIKQVFPASKGVAYLRADFAAPAPTDADWPASSLSMRVLSDLLFNVVRDKYGAVYTPGSYIRAFPANYGSLTVFKTDVPGKVKAYLDEAVAELAAGKAMSVAPGPEEGKTPRMSLEAVLPTYKALYINETYQKIGTNAAVAGEIARSVLQFGDPRAWLLDVARVSAASADEVERATKKWLLDAPATWVLLGPEEMIAPVDDAAFTGWGGK